VTNAAAPESHEAEAKARVLARLIVSEIRLYNPWWPLGIDRIGTDPLVKLRQEIERGREYFNQRVPPRVRASTDHYQEALVSILGIEDPSAFQTVLERPIEKRRGGFSADLRADIWRALSSLRSRDGEVRDPGALEAHYHLGIACMEMGLLQEAIGELELAATDETLLFSSSHLLGICYRESGNSKKAIEWLRRGLKVPGYAEEQYLALHQELAIALPLIESLPEDPEDEE
jgi:tetratricopeptide (TPR) repeat protein